MAGFKLGSVGLIGALPYVQPLMYAPNGVDQVANFISGGVQGFSVGKPGTIAFQAIMDVAGGRFDICRIGASLSERMFDITVEPSAGISDHHLSCQITDANNVYLYYTTSDTAKFSLGVLRSYIVRYDGTTNSNAINFMVAGVDVTPSAQTNGTFSGIRVGSSVTIAGIGPIYDSGTRAKNLIITNTRLTDAQCVEYNNNPASTNFSFAANRTLDLKLNGNLLDASGNGSHGKANIPIFA